jgi:hypothetical protein
MTRGPAGYGRYDDDPEHVGCPYARSDMSPCIARDARLALDEDMLCRGCALGPEELAGELAEAYDPARDLLLTGDPVTLADELAVMVREATEPREEAR